MTARLVLASLALFTTAAPFLVAACASQDRPGGATPSGAPAVPSDDGTSRPDPAPTEAPRAADHYLYTLELSVLEDRVDEFLEVMNDVVRASRREPGVLQYDLLRDRKTPTRFNLVQRYTSLEAARSHLSEPHSQTAFTRLPEILAAPYVQIDYADALPDEEGTNLSDAMESPSAADHYLYTLELSVLEGRVDEFIEVMGDVVRASRREPGVLQYDLLRDRKTPTRFNLVQRYTSLEAALSHLSEPHSQTAFTRLPELLAAPYVQVDYADALPEEEAAEK